MSTKWRTPSQAPPKFPLLEKNTWNRPTALAPRNLVGYWFIIAGFAALYLVLARTSLLLAYGITNASPVWPPSGIALAVIIVVGSHGWPGILVGATAANVWVFWENVGGFKPWPEIIFVSLCIGCGNTGEALIANLVLRALRWGGYPMRTVDGTLKFLFTCPVACCLSSVIGATCLCVWGIAPWTNYWTVWYTWWLGDLSGMLCLTPAILAWCFVPDSPHKKTTEEAKKGRVLEMVEVVILFAALIGVCVLIFGGTVAKRYVVSLPYAVMPFIIWAAFRFNQRGTSLAVLVVTGAATWGSCRYSGSFHRTLLNESLLQLQLFNGVVAIMAIVLAAAVRERIDTLEALNSLNLTLEQRVEERTNDLRALNRALTTSKEAAWAASQAKSQFLASMSHEIRTPIHGILGMTELTLMDTSLSASQKEQLSTVHHSANHLLMIVNDILDISKIEAGKLELVVEPVSIRQVVQSCMQMLSVKARQQGLRWSWDVHPDVPRVLLGDSARLRQCLVNLVGNAVKFTASGFVEVSVKVDSEAATAPASWHPRDSLDSSREAAATPDPQDIVLLFSVKDSGIGIPQDKLEVIFRSFEQGDASMTRLYGGTGLGLSITSRLVEMMGGRIWVLSHPGQGSTFSFSVRMRRTKLRRHSNHDPAARQPGAAPPRAPRGTRSRRIVRWYSAPARLPAGSAVLVEELVGLRTRGMTWEAGRTFLGQDWGEPAAAGGLNWEASGNLPEVQEVPRAQAPADDVASALTGTRGRGSGPRGLVRSSSFPEINVLEAAEERGGGTRKDHCLQLRSHASLPSNSALRDTLLGLDPQRGTGGGSTLASVQETSPKLPRRSSDTTSPLEGPSEEPGKLLEGEKEETGTQPPDVAPGSGSGSGSGPGVKEEGFRILLADDSVVNQMVACRFLRKKGLTVDAVGDGSQALARLESNPGGYDLLLLDVQMPVLDGLDTAKAIREKEAKGDGSHLPIIGLTAHAAEVFRGKCLDAGMDDYVSKPFSMDKLLATMQLVLTRHGSSLPLKVLEL